MRSRISPGGSARRCQRTGSRAPEGRRSTISSCSRRRRPPGLHSRNFVLCPGKAYDRSPCGTGTSAKLACLYADGKLQEGEVWRQESIIGSVFEGTIERSGELLIPTIKGKAWINAEATLLLDPNRSVLLGYPWERRANEIGAGRGRRRHRPVHRLLRDAEGPHSHVDGSRQPCLTMAARSATPA